MCRRALCRPLVGKERVVLRVPRLGGSSGGWGPEGVGFLCSSFFWVDFSLSFFFFFAHAEGMHSALVADHDLRG